MKLSFLYKKVEKMSLYETIVKNLYKKTWMKL